MLYYLRQKPKTCGTIDVDVLAASIQKNCVMTKGRRKARHRSPGRGDSRQPCQRWQGEAVPAGYFSHDVPLSRHGDLGEVYGAHYREGEYTLYPRHGAEVGERQHRRDPQPGYVDYVLDKPEEGSSGEVNQGVGPAKTVIRARIRWDKKRNFILHHFESSFLRRFFSVSMRIIASCVANRNRKIDQKEAQKKLNKEIFLNIIWIGLILNP